MYIHILIFACQNLQIVNISPHFNLRTLSDNIFYLQMPESTAYEYSPNFNLRPLSDNIYYLRIPESAGCEYFTLFQFTYIVQNHFLSSYARIYGS